MKLREQAPGLAACLIAALILAPIFFLKAPWPVQLRDRYEALTIEETGARNVVSAIYLGYRAFDTLGEAIVLFIAVLGTLHVMQQTHAHPAAGFPGNSQLSNPANKGMVKFITGKVGPIILVFGFYVMTFGYSSPGGGFQGGAVIASGIIFIALGYIRTRWAASKQMKNLHSIEVASFVLLIAAFFSGIATGTGFLANPFSHEEIQPVVFITMLNIIVGIKVGASIGLLAIAMYVGGMHE